ncbi:MAG: calcium-binding protein, partial [Brevundimonas sp.]
TYTHTNFTTGVVSTVTPLPLTLLAGTGGDVLFSANIQYADSQSGVLSVTQNGATLRGIETARFIFSSSPNNPGDFAVLGGAGWYRHNPHDTLTIGDLTGTALTGAITFDGGFGDDVLDASAAVNVILGAGGVGNDVLLGGSANDVLSGGDGFDRLSGGSGANVLDGGAGDDLVEYLGATQGVRIDLNDGTVANNGHGLSDTLISIEHLTGGAFNDVLVGNEGGNILTGGLGADVLIGLDGDDVLDGGAGAANTLQGGRGDDRYVVSAAGDTLLELAGEGFDTVQTTLSVYRLRDNFEALEFTGAGAFTGLGNASNNTISGGAGGDTLIGYEGDDILVGGAGAPNTLIGGLGDDVYVSDAVGDSLIELAGEGYDIVSTTLTTYTLRDNFEELRFVQAQGVVADVVGTGNSQNNTLGGHRGADRLAGLAGNDTLNGFEGDDTLRGG